MTQANFNRRGILALGCGASLVAASSPFFRSDAQEVIKEIHDLQPGEFTWHPERSPAGPVAVVASIPEQRVHVYRNGIRIAVSTCSTGAPGHETPTGVFTVLQKDKHHRSSTYNNAPMPNMNRLTWGGIALHAGKLPGYPASHGCIRLPMAFSEKLFDVTHMGTPVIISGSHSDPWELIHPGLVLGAYAETEFAGAVSKLQGKAHPADWSDGEKNPITSLIASSADSTITLIENGAEISSARLTVRGEPRLGEHVFVLRGGNEQGKGMAWQGISHHPDPGQPNQKEEALIQRLSTDPSFAQDLALRIHPGMLLVVTDLPSRPDTKTAADFVIMTVS
ncbi:MAG: L,D-transpeptidase [Burkholderiales bacterium]|nr:L,D-transpeptidase [Burkholderiales bacterium]